MIGDLKLYTGDGSYIGTIDEILGVAAIAMEETVLKNAELNRDKKRDKYSIRESCPIGFTNQSNWCHKSNIMNLCDNTEKCFLKKES